MIPAKDSLFKRSVSAALVLIAALLFLLAAMPKEGSFSVDYPLQEKVYVFGLLLLTGLVCGAAVWMIFRTPQQDRQPRAFLIPLLSGLLALGLLALGYVRVGMWPIGKESAMIVDMHHQYAPLLAYLRDSITGGGNVLYSFETGLGSSFLPMFGYYLASPLNVLLVLFPDRLLTEGILCITMLKVTLSAVFFACMLQYVYKRRTAAVTVVSVLYALMIYMLAYSWNVMWLDVIMVLPLVLLSFERLMRTGRFGAYIFSLAYVLYANYYIGFMACIFLTLYFIAFLLRTRRTAAQNASATLRFFIGSALAGGLVMALLLPVYFGLLQTSAVGASMPDTAANFTLFDLLGRHLYGVTPTIRSGNLPNIACGMLAVVTLPLFATLKTIPLRRRLTYGGLWLVMALSMVVNRFDLLWHGLHAPNDLPYRFSFLYSLVLLLIAYETLLHLKDVSVKQVCLSCAGLAAYLVVEEKFGGGTYGFRSIYVSLMLIGLYGLIAALAGNKVLRTRVAYACLLCVVTAELISHTGQTLEQLNRQEYYTDHQYYVDNLVTETVGQAVRDTQAIAADQLGGQTFYRMEFLPRRTLVDTALFRYRGLTLFSSSNYYQTTRLMNALGFASNGVNSYAYRAFIAPVDSLLGVRYLISNTTQDTVRQLRLLDTVTRSDEPDGENAQTYYIYENQAALPVAFMVQPSVRTWEYSYYDPVTTQQSLFEAITTGLSGTLYTVAPVSVAENASNGSVNPSVSSTYISMSGGSTAARFNATIEAAGQCYVYVDCRAARSASAVVQSAGETFNYSVSPREPYMIDVGIRHPGDVVQVSLTADSGCGGHLYVLTLNEAYCNAALKALRDDAMAVTPYTESNIVGTVNASYSGVLMTTIPYDKGWHVKVDGKTVDTFAVSDALLAFDLSAGSHVVELSFWPRGLTAGLIISGLCAAVVAVLLILLRRRPGDDVTGETFFDGETPAGPPEDPAGDLPFVWEKPAPADAPDDAQWAEDAFVVQDVSLADGPEPAAEEVPATPATSAVPATPATPATSAAPATPGAPAAPAQPAPVQTAPADEPTADAPADLAPEDEEDFLNSFYVQDAKGGADK